MKIIIFLKKCPQRTKFLDFTLSNPIGIAAGFDKVSGIETFLKYSTHFSCPLDSYHANLYF